MTPTPDSRSELTTALEDYLETIFELIRDKPVARVRDIASARGVKAGSVTPAMRRLADLGYVEYGQREYIQLTPLGEREARRIYARHQLLTRFFAEVLALPEDEAQENACAMEHSLSDQAMDRLVRFFEFVGACPACPEKILDLFHMCSLVHPNTDCSHFCTAEPWDLDKTEEIMSLSKLKPGHKATVKKVNGKGAIRQRLLDMGILPEVVVEVERVAPSGDPIWIKLQGFQLSLRLKEADTVLVASGVND